MIGTEALRSRCRGTDSNRRDVAGEIRESRCESEVCTCSGAGGSDPIDCRVWVYQGNERLFRSRERTTETACCDASQQESCCETSQRASCCGPREEADARACGCQ